MRGWVAVVVGLALLYMAGYVLVREAAAQLAEMGLIVR
jgi:hypothetical protein